MTPPNAPSPDFSVITGETIQKLITRDVPAVIRSVEAAYLAHHHGQTVNPNSYFLRFPNNPSARIIALPAHMEGLGGSAAGEGGTGDKPTGETAVSGIKWIASYPSNLQRGIPRASAVLILNDGETGYPFACLESSIISAARTAASAVSGAWYLNGQRRAARHLAIVGTGLIARFILTFFMSTGWRFDRVTLYDRHRDYGTAFKQRLEQEHGLVVDLADSDEAAVRQGDLVLLTTTTGEPYLQAPEVFAHNPLVLNISLRDVGAEVVLGSYNVVDDVEHCLQANTSPHLAEQKSGHREFIYGTLPEILAGMPVPERNKPVIFSPFGMGILDLALGFLIYNQARQEGSLIEVKNFFWEMQRI